MNHNKLVCVIGESYWDTKKDLQYATLYALDKVILSCAWEHRHKAGDRDQEPSAFPKRILYRDDARTGNEKGIIVHPFYRMKL